MPIETRGVLRVDEDGLHLPGSVLNREGKFVIRTPTITIDVPSMSPGVAKYPMVTPEMFGDAIEPADVHDPNRHLYPDRVSIKVYGEDEVAWKVDAATVEATND